MTAWWLAGDPFLLLGGPDGPFNPIDIGNKSLLFWQVVIFGLLFTILLWKVWGPLMKTVTEREKKIQSDLASAEEARRTAEESRAKLQRELDQASASAKSMLAEAEARAAKLKTDLESQARAQAESMIQKAHAQIEAEKAQAIREIRDQVVDLSVEISRRLVGREVGREDHLKEADRLLEKVKVHRS